MENRAIKIKFAFDWLAIIIGIIVSLLFTSIVLFITQNKLNIFEIVAFLALIGLAVGKITGYSISYVIDEELANE